MSAERLAPTSTPPEQPQLEAIEGVQEQNRLVVAEQSLSQRGVSREQGAPEQQTMDGVLETPVEHNVELPESAKPVVTHRKRGGASRPQGPPKSVELAQKLAKKEANLRFTLGSRAMKRIQDSDQFVRGSAIRKLKSEGNDMSMFEPKPVAETTADTAEPEPIDALNESLAAESTDNESSPIFDQLRKERQDKQTAPEGFPSDVWEELTPDERARATEAWAGMSDDERASAFGGRVIPAEKPQPGRHKKEPVVAGTHKREKYEARHKKERVTLRDRFRNLMAAAGAKLAVAQVEAKKYLNDEEKGGRRRRAARVIGAGAVVMAGVGVAYGLHELLSSGGAGTVAEAAGKAKPQKVVKGHEIASKFHQEVLHKGDTYWGLTEKAHPHASEARIHELVAEELKHDHVSWDGARDLPVGKHVSIR